MLVRSVVRVLVLMWVLIWVSACASSDRPLQLLNGQGPVYPQEAQRQRLEGAVEVGYDVSAAGVVENARVISSQPPVVFDAAALEAVRSWRFKAPVVDGVAQPARNLRSTVQFKLGDGSEYDQY